MVDQTLKKSEGLTFDVFTDKQPEVDADGKPIVSDDPEHLIIKEVVREPRMHFY